MKNLLIIIGFLFLLNGTNGFSQVQNQIRMQWVEQIGAEYTDDIRGLVCNTGNRNYIAGDFRLMISADTTSIQSYGSYDIFLACYDNSGNLISLQGAGGKGADELLCMTNDNNDNLILCGYVQDTITIGGYVSEAIGERRFVSKLNSEGQCLWFREIKTGATSLFLTGSDSNGNVYAAGHYKETLSCDEYSVTSNGQRDIYIIKLSPEGEVLNLVSFGGSSDDEITAMTISPSGNVFIAGSGRTSFYIDNFQITADLVPGHSTSSDPFVLCFDQDFHALWKTQIDGEEYCKIQSLTNDTRGNLFASGYFNLHMNIGDSVHYGGDKTTGFIAKFDAAGGINWSRSFGSQQYDYANDIFIHKNGTIFVSGSISDTMRIDNFEFIHPEGYYNTAYLIAIDSNGKAIWGDAITGQNVVGAMARTDHEGNIFYAGFYDQNIETKVDTLTAHGSSDIFLSFYYLCHELFDEISGQDFICPGQTAELTIDSTFADITWNVEVADQYRCSIDHPGLYSVEMVDQYGCFQTDSIEVTLAEVSDFSLGEDVSLPIENTFLLNAPENFSNFQWQDGSSNSSFMAAAVNNEPGLNCYWLIAENEHGCLARDTICIEFYESTAISQFEYVKPAVYPNPASQIVYLMFQENISEQSVNMDFIGLDGTIVLSKQICDFVNPNTIQVDVSNIESGFYFLRLKKDDRIIVQPCVIRH